MRSSSCLLALIASSFALLAACAPHEQETSHTGSHAATGSGGAGSGTVGSATVGTVGSGGAGNTVGAGGEAPWPDTYLAGLEKHGIHGLYTFKLVESDPIPKYTGEFVWTVQLLDTKAMPVGGASLVAVPWMAAHGHGTNPSSFDGAPAAGAGTYTLGTMGLFMPGIWTIKLKVMKNDTVEDEVEFGFLFEG